MTTLTVTQHRVAMNMGDHAQDIVRAFEVDPAETVGELVERLLTDEPFVLSGETKPNVPRYDDYLTIRIAQPKAVFA